MKNILKTPTAAVVSAITLISIAHAESGPIYDNGGASSIEFQKEDGTLKKLIKTPGRVLAIGDELPPMLSQGTQEFGIGGNIDFSDNIAYNLELTYGWYIKDNWQFGFTANVQGEDSDASFGAGLFTEYNFAYNDSKWVPFVGVSAEWARLDSDILDEDSVALGLDIGIKYFVRENIAISFSIGADFAFDDVFPGGDDFQENINIGTRFYF